MTVSEYLNLWKSCQSVMANFDPHYSVSDEQARRIFDQAVMVPYLGEIVELGVCNGRTGAMLCRVAMELGASYTGVDFFGLENTAVDIRTKFEENKLDGDIIESSTEEYGKYWGEIPIDLLFVDAGHDEANVSVDCELWVPKVKPGGVVIFHDYDSESGAHGAVKRHADLATQGWERIDDKGSMLIARRPV